MRKCWLNGRCVIITGASGGLGFNIAKILIEKFGCTVYGIARNKEKMEKNISTLDDKKHLFHYNLFDVSIKENWAEYLKFLNENNVKPDILINNAGFMLPFMKFEDITEQEIDEIIRVNFLSCIYSIRTLMPLLKKSATPSIINVSSAAGHCAIVGESMYCATKSAVRGLTETLIQDYKKKIYVAGVYPGFIKTDILNRIDDKEKNSKLIEMLMMPVEKASKKIVKKIKRKKKRIVLGLDGGYMSNFSALMPKTTPSLVSWVLKTSKIAMFDKLFKEKKQ